ncbi:MAG: hypothetical protein HY648_02345 [Acidobacteria bacterium]|nr:hypothetical protein [Acidobacteriota bacterium]
MLRTLTRTIFYLAIAAFIGLFVWSFLAAQSWQEVAQQAQEVAAQTVKRTNACFDELRQANAEEETDATGGKR